jgi:hypothetical protein
MLTALGGISNSGKISVNGTGVAVGAAATHSSASVTLATFAGGITNSGTISGAIGIFVGGNAGLNQAFLDQTPMESRPATAPSGDAVVTISSFSGGIDNRGSIVANHGPGIVVAGIAHSSGSFTLATFAGGVRNTATISAASLGILVEGQAFKNGSVTISTFAGGIGNSGSVLASAEGIMVAGRAIGSNATVTISNFAGGVSNGGTVSAGADGIAVGGLASGIARPSRYRTSPAASATAAGFLRQPVRASSLAV